MINFLLSKSYISILQGFKSQSLSLGYILYTEEAFINSVIKIHNLILIGDCLNSEIFDPESHDFNWVLQNLKGNFYAFQINESQILLGSSGFGLLPLYHLEEEQAYSSSVALLTQIKGEDKLKLNKKWLLNQYLFNYQFFRDTAYESISLFPSFSYAKVGPNKLDFIQFFDIRDFLKSQSIRKGEHVLGELSKQFIDLVQNYIPDEGAVVSFTGGFDGRTLVSVASGAGKRFSTYSYGKIENDDVHIPKANAATLGIDHFWSDLDAIYSQNHFPESALAYIRNTDGANGYLYAHVNYLKKDVKKHGDILVSGICGSELFRAAHSSGAVTSNALLRLFSEDDYEKYEHYLFSSKALKYVDLKDYQKALKELAVETWNYKTTLEREFDKNKSLYIFTYEEIFRKFFGPWVKDQMTVLKVRTPYVDFDFFKEILCSEFSGAHSEFLTKNPLKRFKGQLFYSEVIRRTNKKLFWMKTGKGYPPAHVNYPLLRPLLFIPFFKKRIHRKIVPNNLDNLGIVSGIKKLNLNEIKHQHSASGFDLNIDFQALESDTMSLSNNVNEAWRDSLLMTIAILRYTRNQTV